MREVLFRPIARSVQKNGAQFERCILRDPETPIGRNLTAGVFQVAVHDRHEIGDLPAARPVRAKPAVIGPIAQAHARFR